MRFTRSTFAVFALVGVACSDSITNAPPKAAPPSVLSADHDGTTGKHLVMFATTLPADFAARVAAAGGTVSSAYREDGLATVSGLSPEGAAMLAAGTGVQVVIPDQDIQLELPSVGLYDQPAAGAPESQADPTTAFWYNRFQWNMRAMKANEAWAAGYKGETQWTAAILDTGIDYTNQNLAGLVDLSRSTSFVNAVDGPYLAFYFPGAHPSADLHYHGTHVASTVSSKAVGTAGVSSYTTLIAVKVCTVLGSCPFSAVLDGVMFAVANGANVMNLSLGSVFNSVGNEAFIQVIERTFRHAYRKGVTVVVAAGNSNINLDNNGTQYAFVCDVPTVICVSATGPTGGPYPDGTNPDAKAPYSNYGTLSIDVAAPGGAALPVWAACSRFSLYFPQCGNGGLWTLGISGTSMAAPHVTGLASLVYQKYGEKYPGKMKSHLLEVSVDDLGPPGRDPVYGMGRINAAKSLADY